MMRRLWVLLIITVIMALGLPAAAQSQAGSQTLHAKLVRVMDTQGFGKPLTAFTVLVPADWQAEGGIIWGQENSACGGMGYNYQWRATAPDGRSGIAIVPTANWRFTNSTYPSSDGCPNTPITNISDYLSAVVQHYRPGARILDFRQRPDLTEGFKQFNSVTPMPLGEMRNWVEAGEVLIAHSIPGGDSRETFAAVVAFSLMRTQPTMGIPGQDFLSGASFPGFSAFAPAGQLDFTASEAIRKSIKPGPEWSRHIAQHHAKMHGIALKGAQDRAEISRQHFNDMNKIREQSWKSWNKSNDYLHRETIESIRGVETYNDPYNGGTVELDNSYDNAWQLDDGSYVLTNDPSFEPYRVFGQDGQQLQAAD